MTISIFDKYARRLALCAAIATGCVHSDPYMVAHAKPTGEPLAVVDDEVRWVTTEREQVGQAEVKDSTGATVGTAQIYENRTRVHTANIWYPMQGRWRLSDEDFFRIVGDQAGVDATERMRARGRSWRTAGIFMVILGAAAASAALWIPNASPLVRASAEGGAAILIPLGGYGLQHGASLSNPDNHAVDRGTADADVARYNQQLHPTAGLSLGGSF